MREKIEEKAKRIQVCLGNLEKVLIKGSKSELKSNKLEKNSFRIQSKSQFSALIGLQNKPVTSKDDPFIYLVSLC